MKFLRFGNNLIKLELIKSVELDDCMDGDFAIYLNYECNDKIKMEVFNTSEEMEVRFNEIEKILNQANHINHSNHMWDIPVIIPSGLEIFDKEVK